MKILNYIIAFFRVVIQRLRQKGIVETVSIKPERNTQDYVNELAILAHEQKLKLGYRNPAIDKQKIDRKKMTYTERRILGLVKEKLNK